ncbi:hypothetical protein L484_012264 [Morus notabilis]|uniref:Uncharacterized protein n=1 Tax=Morus notabilis TaxID=981085 RepID=W9RA76_9ROSA|nr:hypothetical protein L484_012264 [Morus notabilis]
MPKRPFWPPQVDVAESTCWLPPPQGWVKLNIDVALGLEDVVTSVVARNCSSQTLWCCSARFKLTDAETLEFLTLQEALV